MDQAGAMGSLYLFLTGRCACGLRLGLGFIGLKLQVLRFFFRSNGFCFFGLGSVLI